MNQENMSKDQKEVIDVIDRMTSALQDKDIEGIMSTYETNAIIVFEPEKPVSDPAAQRQMFNQMTAMNPRYESTGQEVFVNGDIAVHFTPWSMTGMAPDGTEIKQSGLSVAVLRRQPDGNWLMIFDNPHGQHLMINQ